MNQYIITEEQLQEWEDNLDLITEGAIKTINKVRSRPYNPQAEPMSDEDKHAYSEAYALGKRDGREKVLDELIKFFTIGWFSQSKTVPRDVLLGKLEGLRKGGE